MYISKIKYTNICFRFTTDRIFFCLNILGLFPTSHVKRFLFSKCHEKSESSYRTTYNLHHYFVLLAFFLNPSKFRLLGFNLKVLYDARKPSACKATRTFRFYFYKQLAIYVYKLLKDVFFSIFLEMILKFNKGLSIAGMDTLHGKQRYVYYLCLHN